VSPTLKQSFTKLTKTGTALYSTVHCPIDRLWILGSRGKNPRQAKYSAVFINISYPATLWRLSGATYTCHNLLTSLYE